MKVLKSLFFGTFFLPEIMPIVPVRKTGEDGIGRGKFAAVVQMGVDVGGCTDIAVTEPFLNLF